MGNETIVLHLDAWLLLSLTGLGFGTGVWIIWRLLQRVSDMTFEKIDHKIDECQHDLRNEINDTHAHATHAHERVGRIEDILMHHGIKGIKQ